MRPYALKKDDPKAIQANTTLSTTGIQTSHLALLEATCSKIGDTFHESAHPIFTQKSILTNIQERKTQDNASIRSCLFNSITSTGCLQTTNCFNQRPATSATAITLDLSNSQVTNQTQDLSSCLKIKTEHTVDHNQNYTEGMHICPNVINEARLLESQARASFNRSCSHESQSPSCSHQTNTSEPSTLNTMNQQQQPSACQHENTSNLSHIPSPSGSNASSCLFQSSPSGSSQSPSCAMATLTHLPISSNSNNNNNNIFCENSSFAARQKTTPSINPWQMQTVHRSTQEVGQKSSCMLHENLNTISSANTTQHTLSSSPQERAFRTYSPPDQQQDRQFTTNFRSPEYGPPSIDSQHTSPHYNQTIHSPHQHSFDGYGTFENTMDVKPDPYILHQQSLRQGHSTSMIPGSYDNHTHNMANLQNSLEPLNTPVSLQNPYHLSHGHPSALSYGNPGYPGNFPIHQNPDLVPGNPMAGPPEMVPPNFADYQYQQQMFYSRENRRPRRIACTCPNCRDGENKTVTTKDGKQRKLHVCHIPGCGKEYGKTSHLRAHLRWHAGERPFACNWLYCNKRFTRSDELQRHRRTHTGDKRFECTTCFKKFMRSDHLSKHMKTHQSQNKQGKDKSTDNNTDKNKTVPKTTQQHKQTVIQNDKSKMTTLGLPESLNL